MKKFLTITVLILFGLAIWSMGKTLETTSKSVRPTSMYRAPAKEATTVYVMVTYRITCKNCGGITQTLADLTYSNATGGTEQREVKLPWEAKFTMRRGAFAYLSAQNHHDSGDVKVEILVGGTVWKVASSEGAYVIATCSGSVP